MLAAASKHSTRHVALLAGLAAAVLVIVLFALLLQLILGLAAPPPSGQVTGSFGANRPADYARGAERPVAPQRSS